MQIAKLSYSRIYFIGIGGIGISALAQYFLNQKIKVSGSDLVSSEITDFLKKKGAKIHIGHTRKNITRDLNLVIYSPAVKNDNPEIIEAKKLGIQTLSYPRALGQLTKKYFTIAVCGAHGKSTTTAMIAKILIEAGFNPTVIIGTKLKEFGDTNFRTGANSKILLIEADEFKASFLNYWPKIIVLTNIEAEHLDYYKNLVNVLKTFKLFISHLGKTGTLIFNKDNKNASRLAKGKKAVFFSKKQKEFDKIKIILPVPGDHNVLNALAALSCARLLGIPDKVSLAAISKYKGAWRRMETSFANIENKRVTIISDYGHHPTEIDVTVRAIQEKYKNKKIWLIYQPHQYQRTHYLFNDFVKVLGNLNLEKIILAPIYEVAGRETSALISKVSSEKLAQVIYKKNKNVIALPDFKTIKKYILKNFDADILIFMGAGDIYLLANKF